MYSFIHALILIILVADNRPGKKTRVDEDLPYTPFARTLRRDNTTGRDIALSSRYGSGELALHNAANFIRKRMTEVKAEVTKLEKIYDKQEKEIQALNNLIEELELS